ncbi:MAG: EAL domain-containing protein [Deltaproteobacteria bacterium]|nr:MAG: EAL domain-containing protein [Deltaproteobacteria bacterium]
MGRDDGYDMGREPAQTRTPDPARLQRLLTLFGNEAVRDTLYDGLMVVHATGLVEPLNRAAVTLLESATGRPVPAFSPDTSALDVVDSEGRPMPPPERPAQRAVVRGETVRGEVFGLRRPDPETGEPVVVRWLRVSALPLPRDLAPEAPAALLSLVDVTPRVSAEQRLRQSAAAFDNTTEAVVISDDRGRIVAVNPAFTSLTGYPASEVMGLGMDDFPCTIANRDVFAQIGRALATDGQWQGETVGVRKDGSGFPAWMTASAVHSPEGRLLNVVTVFSDISPLKEVQDRLAHQAHHDDLTDLPNRVLARERLQEALTRATRDRCGVAVLFLDLDRFKVVNDSLGHVTGDHLLQAVARRLREVVGDAHLLARIGGDEFLVIVDPAPDRAALAALADRIIAAVDRPFDVPDAEEIYIGVSVGITRFPGDGITADDLIRNADAALYAAKDAGRGAHHFYREDLTRAAARRLRLEQDMRRALRDDAFLLAFQPMVSMDGQRVVGMETLLRWREDDEERVTPDVFIPVAEDTGLIRPLGEWVLRHALQEMRRWIDAGIAPKRIAVNVSAAQLRRQDFAVLVQRLLEENGIAPGQLELELTEGALFADTDRMLDLLHDLDRLGVRVAVDDFGTGYSSLAYLQRFPIHRLKMDRSFVSALPHCPQGTAIASAIVNLGRALDLDILAEGVEQDAQLAALQALGCNAWQGFLCAPALMREEAFAFLAACARGAPPATWPGNGATSRDALSSLDLPASRPKA